MKIIFCSIAVAILLAACTPAGGIRPTAFNYPPSYLKNFSLNTITEDEMLHKAGPPDREIQISGKRALVYKANQAGNMTYTYILEKGIVTDVIYNENGVLNGDTAKAEQQKP